MYRGCVDVKSFDRKNAIDKKESIVILHKGQKMTLSANDVKVKIKAKSPLQTSKIGGEDYYLYSYKWNPDLNQD